MHLKVWRQLLARTLGVESVGKGDHNAFRRGRKPRKILPVHVALLVLLFLRT